MEIKTYNKIKRKKPKHQAEVSMQTGFPSPATHYLEPTIDLNEALVEHPEATFYVRIGGKRWENLHIYEKDVLIIDRAATFKKGKIALVKQDGAFEIMAFPSTGSKIPYELWGVITYVIHPTW